MYDLADIVNESNEQISDKMMIAKVSGSLGYLRTEVKWEHFQSFCAAARNLIKYELSIDIPLEAFEKKIPLLKFFVSKVESNLASVVTDEFISQDDYSYFEGFSHHDDIELIMADEIVAIRLEIRKAENAKLRARGELNKKRKVDAVDSFKLFISDFEKIKSRNTDEVFDEMIAMTSVAELLKMADFVRSNDITYQSKLDDCCDFDSEDDDTWSDNAVDSNDHDLW